jgi:threonine dehydratase
VTELGLRGRLFLPTTVTATKRDAIESSGVPFELVGDDCVETEGHARAFAAANRLVWISPYNDPVVVAGQGTVAPELLEQLDDLDAVLVPVGGGGLAGGIAGYLAAVAPAIRVIGCEPEASPVMTRSVAAGEIVELPNLATLSDATAGGIEANSITFELCRNHVDRWQLVDEGEIAAAIRFLHDRERMVVEGGAALGVAVLLQRPEHLLGTRVAVVITGSRIDPAVLRRVLEG